MSFKSHIDFNDIFPSALVRDALAVASLLLLIGSLFMIRQARNPQIYYNGDWVTWEPGNQLHRADLILSGHLIHRDFASQYGVLPAYSCAALAGLTGVSIFGVLMYHLVFRMIAFIIFFIILRRCMGPGLAFVAGAAAGVPIFTPVLRLGPHYTQESGPMEMVLLAAVMAIYMPPGRRGPGRCLALGLLLGLCQWVKFGGAFVAGAAIVLVDAIWLLRARDETGPRARRWLADMLRVLAGFLLLELSLAGLAFWLCPADVARDVVWPSYMLDDYTLYPRSERWPDFIGWKYFLSHQLIFLSSFGVGLAFLAYDGYRRFVDAPERSAAGYVGLVFFSLGLFVYLKHKYLIEQYAWLLLPAACFSLVRFRWPARTILLLAWSPTFLFVLKESLWASRPTYVQPYSVSASDVIYIGPEQRAEIEDIRLAVAAVHRVHPGGHVFFMQAWSSGSFYHYFGSAPPLRNLLPAQYFYRPYDIEELRRKLDDVAAFIWTRPADLRRSSLGGVFSPALAEEILGTYEPLVGSPGGITVLIRKDHGASPEGDRGPRGRVQ